MNGYTLNNDGSCAVAINGDIRIVTSEEFAVILPALKILYPNSHVLWEREDEEYTDEDGETEFIYGSKSVKMW